MGYARQTRRTFKITGTKSGGRKTITRRPAKDGRKTKVRRKRR